MAEQRPEHCGVIGSLTACAKCGVDLVVISTEKGDQITAFMGLKCNDGKPHEPKEHGVSVRVF